MFFCCAGRKTDGRDRRARACMHTCIHIHPFVQVLWKTPALLAWLQRAAGGAIQHYEARGAVAAEPRLCREMPATRYRTLLLSNFSDAVTTLPREALEDDGEMGGGLGMEAGAGAEEVGGVNRLDPNANPLMLFLQVCV